MKDKQPPIRAVIMHGTKSWCMDGRYHGTKREYFPTKRQAETRAAALYLSISEKGPELAAISQFDLLDLKRAQQILSPYGTSVLKAAEFYVDHIKKSPIKKEVDQAVEKWLKHKETAELKHASMQNLRRRLSVFCERFGRQYLSDIGYDEAYDWLLELPLSRSGKIDYRKTLNEFFEWCIWPSEWIKSNPFAKIELKKGDSKEVEIFSVEKAIEVFLEAQKADEDIFAHVILCMFCGLRSDAEAPVAMKEHLDVKSNSLRVHSSKTAKIRYVDLEEGVLNRLIKLDWTHKTNFDNRWNAFRAALGYRVWVPEKKTVDGKQVFFSSVAADESRPMWPRNVLRHTYCSYHLAKFRDAALTAHKAGHQVKVLQEHYKRPLPKTEGDRFWNIIL